MVLRIFLRYIANNENLVNKLAESKPIRRAAQMVVYLLNRTSSISGAHSLPSNTKEFGHQVINVAKRFSANFQKELKEAREELKRKQSK